MQTMQNISPLFFLSKDQKSKISESRINSRTCLGHLVLFICRSPFIPCLHAYNMWKSVLS